MKTTLMGVLVAVGLAGFVAVGLAAEKKVDVSKLPAPASKTGLTFDKDIKPLVERSCAKCHGGDRPKGQYVVASRDAFIKGGEAGKPVVKAGKSAESSVVHLAADLVPEMEMPPLDKRDKFPGFTKDEIALLRAWIDQGAK